MKWLQTVRALRREWRDAEALLACAKGDRRLLVYSEDIHSYNQFQGYLDALYENYGRSITYVTSAPNDPLLARDRMGMFVYYVNQLLPTVLSRLDCNILLLTMPDLGNYRIPRPNKGCCCVYVFHSLASVHQIYPEGAFDHYDAFFCTGPHHRRELERYFSTRPSMPTLYNVGYYKLDRVLHTHATFVKRSRATTVLVAPSWGAGNVLETRGVEIVERLLSLGVKVIVRPHPCFFQSIYPAGRSVMEELSRRFGNHTEVEIEYDINTEDALHEADLMISDFSGAAYEYAFGTLRPVLFVDVPRKTRNARWHELGLPTFEDTMRPKVGKVIPAGDIANLQRHTADLLDERAAYAQQLESLRANAIYNVGNSASVGAEIIDQLLVNEDTRSTAAGFMVGTVHS